MTWKKVILEEAKKRILEKHGEQLKLVDSTFVDANTKCSFVDVEFGEWIASPGNIFNGHGHPQRGRRNAKQKISIDLDEVKKRIQEKHGSTVRIIESTFTKFLKIAMFIDSQHGEFNEIVRYVCCGKSHPQRILDRRIGTYGFCKKEIQEKCKQVWLSKGVTNPSQLESSKLKSQETCMRNFGVKFPQQSAEIRKKSRDSVRLSRGVDNVSKDESVKLKKKETNLKLIGFQSNLNVESVKLKAKSKQAWNKRHQTMKRNDSYKISKIEESMFLVLVEYFGENDVERQCVINQSWPIDFYIKSIDTYVQLDGVYWHGLDRSLDLIKEFKNPRDRSIHNKWFFDRKQDEFFDQHKLKLIRITDIEFKEFGIKILLDRINASCA